MLFSTSLLQCKLSFMLNCLSCRLFFYTLYYIASERLHIREFIMFDWEYQMKAELITSTEKCECLAEFITELRQELRIIFTQNAVKTFKSNCTK